MHHLSQILGIKSHTEKPLTASFCSDLGNGYIEGTELDGFLREFVASVNSTDTSPEVMG